jgi:hypothetical protein
MAQQDREEEGLPVKSGEVELAATIPLTCVPCPPHVALEYGSASGVISRLLKPL